MIYIKNTAYRFLIFEPMYVHVECLITNKYIFISISVTLGLDRNLNNLFIKYRDLFIVFSVRIKRTTSVIF